MRSALRVALVVGALACGAASDANADDLIPRIGIAKGYNHTDRPSQMFGFDYGDNWELTAAHVGHDSTTKFGPMPEHWAFTAARVGHLPKTWTITPYGKIGIAYVKHPEPLLGCDYQYVLGVGIRKGRVTFGFDHISSAGVCSPNHGWDALVLKLDLIKR